MDFVMSTETIKLKGTIKNVDRTVMNMTATISKGYDSNEISKTIVNQELYVANLVECRKYETAFNEQVQKKQDELLSK